MRGSRRILLLASSVNQRTMFGLQLDRVSAPWIQGKQVKDTKMRKCIGRGRCSAEHQVTVLQPDTVSRPCIWTASRSKACDRLQSIPRCAEPQSSSRLHSIPSCAVTQSSSKHFVDPAYERQAGQEAQEDLWSVPGCAEHHIKVMQPDIAGLLCMHVSSIQPYGHLRN